MRGFLENKKIEIRNPNAIRPWQHVLDLLRGYLLLIEKLWDDGQQFSGSWNFGPDTKEIQPVSWIVQKLNSKWNFNIETLKQESFHEEQKLFLDSSKSHTELGWQPKFDLNTTLDKTIEWYDKFRTNQNMNEISNKQLDDYIGLENVIS